MLGFIHQFQLYMNTLIHLLLATLACMNSVRAQDCAGMTLKPGMTFEQQTFMKNDKLLSTAKYRVTGVSREGGATVVKMDVQTFDAFERTKNPPVVHTRFTCTGTDILLDFSTMATSLKNEDMPDMTVKMTANKVTFPVRLRVGQSIQDGTVAMQMTSAGKPYGTMDMRMSNQKVTGRESVKTPAGLFNAYKITSDVSTKMQMGTMKNTMTMQKVTYRVPDQLLDVRTEMYRGKTLISYTLLSKIN